MPQLDYTDKVAKSIMMSRYNQSYTEIEKIPYTDFLFFLRLVEAEEIYNKQETDKMESEMKRMKNKMRNR